MTKVSKTFTFEAAHRLLRHDGKCKNLHGHSYRVVVTVEGPTKQGKADDPETGMVIDFGRLKDWWLTLESQLDHRTILETEDVIAEALEKAGQQVSLVSFPPTAENIAEWLRADLDSWLANTGYPSIFVDGVRVWETATSWAEA